MNELVSFSIHFPVAAQNFPQSFAMAVRNDVEETEIEEVEVKKVKTKPEVIKAPAKKK